MGAAVDRLIAKLAGPADEARDDHGRWTAGVSIADQRPAGSTPLHIDKAGLAHAMQAAGVKPGTKIRLRLRPQQSSGDQGVTTRVGPDEFRVVVKVAPKNEFSDHHLYILNSTLEHELRHVAQEQADPQMNAKYQQQNKTVGYGRNKYEIEAGYYGHKADTTGTKSTASPFHGGVNAGPAQGKRIWGIRAG